MGAFDMINLVQMAQQQGQKIGTPGINPAAPDPRPQGALNKFDQFLGTPGGGFLMNLLAQSGYSPVPQSPFGAIGRAALLSQQQGQQRKQSDLQEQLIRSQVGLNKAKTVGELVGGESEKPLTELAKLRADVLAKRLSPEVFEAKRDEALRANTDNQFNQTKLLRGEFRGDTDAVRTSQSALANAKALIVQGSDPISATAAFTSFIRSIDNSVVRPAEQAAYSSAGGLARRLQDELSKLSGKGPLSDDTKRDLVNAIETLENQMNGIHQRTVDYYNSEAKKYRLDPESVTGLPSQTSPKASLTPSFDGPYSPGLPGNATDLQRQLDETDRELAEVNRQLQDANN